jgi:hypothetical protein
MWVVIKKFGEGDDGGLVTSLHRAFDGAFARLRKLCDESRDNVEFVATRVADELADTERHRAGVHIRLGDGEYVEMFTCEVED